MLAVDGNKKVTANLSIPSATCGGWTFVPTVAKPHSREYPAAIWDPVRHRMVMFGGLQLDPTFGPLGDTWGLTMGATPAWSQIATGSGGRWDVSPFYDP